MSQLCDFGPYRVGSFTLPAVWIESFLLLSQSFGLHGVHPPLLTLHLLPLVTQDDTNGSGVEISRGRGWRIDEHTYVHTFLTDLNLKLFAMKHLIAS